MADPACVDPRVVVVAVSGTLQEGFPLRKNLDYHDEVTGELRYPAEFLGWALCRGMKSYFDVKDAACREYVDPADGTLRATNPAIVATGNPLHANIYAVYLVHEKAALNALLNEPRLLSMSPDCAKVDLTAKETSDSVKQLCAAAIAEAGASNTEAISLLTVICTVFAPSFVENPPLYTLEDGTEVTNFHDGLAKLCGTTDATRLAEPEKYYASVDAALRKLQRDAGWSQVHGTDKATLRLIKRYTPEEFKGLQEKAGNPVPPQ